MKPVLLVTAATTALLVMPAWAQTAAGGQVAATPAATDEAATTAEQAKDIVVTGTLIRGAAPVGSAIIGVSRQDIVQTGLATTEDILKTVPQITNIGPSANAGAVVTQASNANNIRSESVNIRGIGPQATLVLLDGRRLPAGGVNGGIFDASAFPAIALARVDVVADGASATYGSDAVAGVANFILRKQVNGLELQGRGGFADDTNSEQVSGIFGHRWNTGSIMVAGEYYHATRLLQSDRAAFNNCNETPYGYANNCVAANGAPQAAEITAPGNLVFTTGTPRVYGLPAGTGVGVTAAQLSATPNIGSNTTGQAILPATKRYSIVVSAHQDLGAVTLWTEGYFTKRNATIDAGLLNFSASVPITNPNFVVVPGQSTTTETVQYALLNDYGFLRRPVFEQGYQGAIGLDARLGDNFQGTVYYEHNGNRTNYVTPAINTPLLTAALACTTANVCFNPYGSGGSASNAAAQATFIGFQNQNAYFDSNLVNAKIDGTLAHLPGGAVKLAVGGEYHSDKFLNYNFQNSGANSPTLNDIVVSNNSRITRNIGSLFAEVIVPIFGEENARPGLYKLTFDGAVRYDHYSGIGGTTNPKFGITYSPVRDLTLRGSFGTSFRAPTLCDSNPLCTPAALQTTAALTTLYGQRNSNAVTIVGGNSAVRPETAHTFSAGFDYKPRAIPGLAISLNYFNIDYKNVIYPAGNSTAVFINPQYAAYISAASGPQYGVNPTAAQVASILSLPFVTGLSFANAATPGCSNITAANVATTYQCVGAIIDGQRQNAGEEKLAGLDFSAAYAMPAWGGHVNLGIFGTYLFNYDIALVPGAPFVASLNQLSSIDAGLGALIRFRARGQLGFGTRAFDANAFLNYTNAYRIVGLVNAAQNDRVSPYATLDLTFGYTIPWQNRVVHDIRLGANIINATNRRPPIAVVGLTQQYDPTQANIVGRQVSFTLGAKF